MIKLVIGCPAYNHQVGSHHAEGLMMLAAAATASPNITIVGSHYQHGCPPEIARNQIMERALDNAEATHLLSVDADVGWNHRGIRHLLEMIRCCGSRHPLVGALYPQRDDRYAVWMADAGDRIRVGEPKPGAGYVHAIGLGLVVFDLARYRAMWPTAPWFRTRWKEGVFASEDYVHTSELESHLRRQPYLYDTAFMPSHRPGYRNADATR